MFLSTQGTLPTILKLEPRELLSHTGPVLWWYDLEKTTDFLLALVPPSENEIQLLAKS